MEPIIFEPTATTPRIEFLPTGKLLLEGRSLPEDVFKIFNPIIEFANNLQVPFVEFDVNLEYFNTATSKKLMELFRALDSNENINKLCITWHYEYGDEDSFETAEIYEDVLKNCEFSYNEYPEVELSV